VNQQIADLLLSDASDAPQRFGAEQSPLYDRLKWALAAKASFNHGLGEVVSSLRNLERSVAELPSTGIPRDLRENVQGEMEAVTDLLAREDFFKYRPDLNTCLTAIEGRVASAADSMGKAQAERLLAAETELSLLPEWDEFTAEEQASTLSDIQRQAISVTADIAGFQRLIARHFDIESTIAETKAQIVKEGRARRFQNSSAYPTPSGPTVNGGFVEDQSPSPTIRPEVRGRRQVSLPATIGSVSDLDNLIATLYALRRVLADSDIDLVLKGE
jgi:hypothetical protein